MKRLSLLAFATMLLVSASGCCCGLGHGCGSNCCGYGGGGCSPCGQAAYPMGASGGCPTCPNGGCSPSGPVFQGTSYFGPTDVMQASAAPQAPQAFASAPTLASANTLPTY